MPQIFKIAGYLVFFWSNESEPLEPIHGREGRRRQRDPPGRRGLHSPAGRAGMITPARKDSVLPEA